MDPIEEIKSELDIVSFVGEYVKLTRAGRNLKGLCPFHSEKTPSFMVSPELGIWRCFGACSEGGDVIKFYMKAENLDFGEAIKALAQKAGVKLTSRVSVKASDKEALYEINAQAAKLYNYLLTQHSAGITALSYIKHDRGINDGTVKTFGIGFAPDKTDTLQKFLEKKGYKTSDLVKAGLVIEVVQEGRKRVIDRFKSRIIFPLRNHRGEVVGFSGRVLPKDETKNVGKYVNTPETLIYHKRSHMFGLDVTRNEIIKTRSAVVVEGEFDLMSCWQEGIKNVVAIKGSAFTQEYMNLLLRFADEIVLALDMDEAGQHAARQTLILAEQNGLRVRTARIVGFKDPDEAVRKDPQSLIDAITRAVGAYDYFIQEALRKYDAKTADGVRQISQSVAPLLAIINDSIVQAHYVRVLAEKLRISEEAVGTQVEKLVKKQTVNSGPGVNSNNASNVKSRRQLLEEQITALSLLHDPKFLIDAQKTMPFTTPVLIRIYEELVLYLAGGKAFETPEFISSLPSELVDAATAIVMQASAESEADRQSLNKELSEALRDLEILSIQESIVLLTNQIREEEKNGLPVESKQEELARTISDLAKLEKRNHYM